MEGCRKTTEAAPNRPRDDSSSRPQIGWAEGKADRACVPCLLSGTTEEGEVTWGDLWEEFGPKRDYDGTIVRAEAICNNCKHPERRETENLQPLTPRFAPPSAGAPRLPPTP